mgnify:CR=1 FL=1
MSSSGSCVVHVSELPLGNFQATLAPLPYIVAGCPTAYFTRSVQYVHGVFFAAHRFREYAEERMDQERTHAERLARAAAWEREKEEAKLNKVCLLLWLLLLLLNLECIAWVGYQYLCIVQV